VCSSDLRSRDTNNRILAELTKNNSWQGKAARK
jgi:hypothetical protein